MNLYSVLVINGLVLFLIIKSQFRCLDKCVKLKAKAG